MTHSRHGPVFNRGKNRLRLRPLSTASFARNLTRQSYATHELPNYRTTEHSARRHTSGIAPSQHSGQPAGYGNAQVARYCGVVPSISLERSVTKYDAMLFFDMNGGFAAYGFLAE